MTYKVKLNASGREFTVNEGEAILDAAQRAGLALPYSCRSGLCGSCKALVLEGRFHYPHLPPSALSAAEQAEKAALLCQAVPQSDLLLAVREVRSVEDMPRRTIKVQVTDKQQVADNVMLVRMVPKAGEPALKWLPGQYIHVLREHGKKRPFSLARAPHLGNELEIHVREVKGGGFSAYAVHTLKVGDELTIQGPQGTFVAREDTERPMLMVAGGTGIAPIKALIEHFMHLHTRRKIHLYWGAASQAELYLIDKARAWAQAVPQAAFTPVVAGAGEGKGVRHGLVHAAVLDDYPDLSAYDVYMCGPPGLIEVGRSSFVKAGLPEDHLYFDSFEYAPDVLDAILGKRAGIHGL